MTLLDPEAFPLASRMAPLRPGVVYSPSPCQASRTSRGRVVGGGGRGLWTSLR